jgi:hypothetical protein
MLDATCTQHSCLMSVCGFSAVPPTDPPCSAYHRCCTRVPRDAIIHSITTHLHPQPVLLLAVLLPTYYCTTPARLQTAVLYCLHCTMRLILAIAVLGNSGDLCRLKKFCDWYTFTAKNGLKVFLPHINETIMLQFCPVSLTGLPFCTLQWKRF